MIGSSCMTIPPGCRASAPGAKPFWSPPIAPLAPGYMRRRPKHGRPLPGTGAAVSARRWRLRGGQGAPAVVRLLTPILGPCRIAYFGAAITAGYIGDAAFGDLTHEGAQA